MSPNYPDVQRYVINREWVSLHIPNKPSLSDLELAIVGYVKRCPEIIVSEHTTAAAPYHSVYELIFEYFKHNKGERELKKVIDENISILEKELSYREEIAASRNVVSSRYISDVTNLIEYFKGLKKKRISQISYPELQPKEWSRVVNMNETPFKKVFNEKIKNILEWEILLKSGTGRKWYLALNPNIAISRA